MYAHFVSAGIDCLACATSTATHIRRALASPAAGSFKTPLHHATSSPALITSLCFLFHPPLPSAPLRPRGWPSRAAHPPPSSAEVFLDGTSFVCRPTSRALNFALSCVAIVWALLAVFGCAGGGGGGGELTKFSIFLWGSGGHSRTLYWPEN